MEKFIFNGVTNLVCESIFFSKLIAKRRPAHELGQVGSTLRVYGAQIFAGTKLVTDLVFFPMILHFCRLPALLVHAGLFQVARSLRYLMCFNTRGGVESMII